MTDSQISENARNERTEIGKGETFRSSIGVRTIKMLSKCTVVHFLHVNLVF